MAIEKIEKINFFSNCSKSLNNANANFISVNKDFMCKSISSNEWEDYTLEQANILTSFLSQKAPNEYSLYWNIFAEKFRQCWKESLEQSISQKIQAAHLSNDILPDIAWNLSHYVIMKSFDFYNPPGFFESIFLVYEMGKLPCGMENYNDFKNGKLLIY